MLKSEIAIAGVTHISAHYRSSTDFGFKAAAFTPIGIERTEQLKQSCRRSVMYITERFAVGVCFDVDIPQVLACFGNGKLNCSFKNIKHMRLGIGGKE